MFEDIQKNSAVIGNNMKIDIDKDIFGFYTLCIGLLLGKILLMSIVTEKNRFANHVSAIIHDIFCYAFFVPEHSSIS